MKDTGTRRRIVVALVGVAAFFVGSVAAQAQSFTAGSAEGSVGGTADVSVTVGVGSLTVASGQVDIGYDPAIASLADKTACKVNDAINKGATAFALRPPGCTGGDCNAVRAAITSTDNTDPIPDGSVVFTCTFDLNAAGTSEITVSNGIVSDADGNETDATGNNGSIAVSEAPPATDTPTATETPAVPTATDTPAATATRTPRPPGGGGQDDDGCQMVAPADASMGWMLLVPAALLIWRRRRAL